MNLPLKDVSTVLTQAIDLWDKEAAGGMLKLSNHIIHSASIYQDKFSVTTAIIIYSLGKVLEREKILRYKDWNKYKKKIRNLLKQLLINLGKRDEFTNISRKILKNIVIMDSRFKEFVDFVIQKARLTKAGKIFEHGISLGRASKITGINMWDLVNYAGKKEIYIPKTIEVSDRLKEILNFLGEKA